MLEIRKATVADIEVLTGLYQEVSAYMMDGMPEHFCNLDQTPVPDFRADIQEDSMTIFVAEINKKVIGYAICSFLKDITHRKHDRIGYVNSIGVSKGYRGQGIGKKMMLGIESYFKNSAVHRLELGVYNFEGGAYSFYEELGYGIDKFQMGKDLS